jgi:hypothetical protein
MIAWAASNVLIQTIAGILGAHGAAVAAHEHRFGFLGHTATGAVVGALSGNFLQTVVVTVVTAGGAVNEPTAVENAMLQVLTGLVVGGCAMLTIGLLKYLAAEHRAGANEARDD